MWVHATYVNKDAYVNLVKFVRSLKMVSHHTRTIIQTSQRSPIVTSEFSVGRFKHMPWYPVDKDEVGSFLKQIDPKANFEHALQLTGGLPKQLFNLVNGKTEERFLTNTILDNYDLWTVFDADFWKETIMPHCGYYDSFTMGSLLTKPIQRYIIKLETLGDNKTVNAMLKAWETRRVIEYDQKYKGWKFAKNSVGYLLCEKECFDFLLQ